MSHLSIEDRYAIIALDKHCHWKQERIAEAIGCTQQAVSKILHKWKYDHTIEDLPRSGAPPIINTSNTQHNPITDSIREHRNYTSNQIQEQLDVSVSARTIRRYREQLGFKPIHYRRRPLLTREKEIERLYYCIDNMENDWKDIIFTDETTFIPTDEREIVWKRPESPVPVKSVTRFKESFMVWGGVWWDGMVVLIYVLLMVL
jgi:transposase